MSESTHSNRLQRGHVLNGRYSIIGDIGEGGMSVVYQAFDRNEDQLVAIKQVQIPGDDQQAKEAFEREAKLLKQLEHDNLPCFIEHFNGGNGTPGNFLIMQFITGDDLATRLKEQERAFDEKHIRTWASVILDVLDYLHEREQPIIHRDIKPANIMLAGREEKLYLIDFGLAVAQAQHSTGTTGRTPHYAPPEQDQGRIVNDPRSDFYALGATFYTLCTHRLPEDSRERKSGPDQLIPAADINRKVTKEFSQALAKMMALDIEERPRNVAEIRKDLGLPQPKRSRFAVDTTPFPAPAPAPAPAPTTDPRREGGMKRVFIGVGAAVVLIIVLAILFARPEEPPQPDFVEAEGVRPEYVYTGCVEATGAHNARTPVFAEPDFDADISGHITTETQVEIVKDEEEWYHIRASSGQGADVDAEGWVQRWLVDGTGAPSLPPACATVLEHESGNLLPGTCLVQGQTIEYNAFGFEPEEEVTREFLRDGERKYSSSIIANEDGESVVERFVTSPDNSEPGTWRIEFLSEEHTAVLHFVVIADEDQLSSCD